MENPAMSIGILRCVVRRLEEGKAEVVVVEEEVVEVVEEVEEEGWRK